MIPIALIVAAGTTGTAIALSTAERTADAYDDYRRRSEVSDVVINPDTNTAQIDEVIRTLPGVERVTMDPYFRHHARRRPTPAARRGRLRRGVRDHRARVQRRPLDGDGPAGRAVRPHAGERHRGGDHRRHRRVAGPRDRRHGGIAFWQPRVNPYLGLEPVGEYGDEIIEPIAVGEVEIVGIVVLPGQVLPDELFRRAEMIVSPELSARYDCVPDIPRPGATFAEAVATLLPADCKVAFPTARCASPTARPRCNRRWTSSWTAPPG